MRGVLCYSSCQSPSSSFSPNRIYRNPSTNSHPSRSVSISTATPSISDEPSTAVAAKPLRRRRLILLRHAASTAPNRLIKDHDRPLSRIGRADAVVVSKKLQQMEWIPEIIFSSDASRTKETLKIMQEHASGFSEAKVYFIPSFYSTAAMDGQTADHLQKVICEYSNDEILTVMCMGHNRGWEEAASMLSGASIELKPCNAALLEASGKSWNETFVSAGLGGWKLQGIVKPDAS